MSEMPEIITYDTPSDSSKKKAKQNNPWYVSKSVYSWFRSQDKFTKTYVIAFLLIASATPFIASQYLNFNQNAQYSQPQNVNAPAVTIASPKDGELVKSDSEILIIADVTGEIEAQRVEIFVNKTLSCTVNTAPYVCQWRVPQGVGTEYEISAKAIDSSGNSNTKAIKVTSQ